jgi:hypothetical protein
MNISMQVFRYDESHSRRRISSGSGFCCLASPVPIYRGRYLVDSIPAAHHGVVSNFFREHLYGRPSGGLHRLQGPGLEGDLRQKESVFACPGGIVRRGY